MKNFLLPTKPKIVFQLENPVQFGRRALRQLAERRGGMFDNLPCGPRQNRTAVSTMRMWRRAIRP